MMLESLSKERAIVLVIDLQEKLTPAMLEAEATLAAARRLLAGAEALGVPVLATEQYPAGLGRTCAGLAEMLQPARVFEKMSFSSYTAQVREAINKSARNQLIVTGVEAHVCVQQSVLDLRREGRPVWVCADAISSRRALDRDIAIERMRAAGAVITTVESVLFEMLGEAGTDAFKKILKIVK